MITTSPSVAIIADAVRLARAAMKPAKKSGTNDLFESDYSTLEDVWKVIQKPVAQNGLVIVQSEPLAEIDSVATVETLVMHSSGEWIQTTAAAPCLRSGDAAAAEHTRLRRRALCALFGLKQADSDGRFQSSTADKAAEVRREIEARR